MKFIDPGIEFLKTNSPIHEKNQIASYLKFLCDTANVLLEPPIDLDAIYFHFKIKLYKESLGNELQGLSNSDLGFVFINKDDISVRQRFTKGHELVEFLCKAQKHLVEMNEIEKERFCDFGSANLLMPRHYIENILDRKKPSFDTASDISDECQTSFMSSLVQMINYSKIPSAIIICTEDYKPTEIKNKTKNSSKKLRIKKASSNSLGFPYIPKHKSISNSSDIYKSYKNGMYITSTENISLGKINISCHIESKTIQIKDELFVVSLLQKI